MANLSDFQETDPDRPTKRARLDPTTDALIPTANTPEESMDDGDWDDIYGGADATTSPNKKNPTNPQAVSALPNASINSAPGGAAEGVQTSTLHSSKNDTTSGLEGVPMEALDSGDALVHDHHHGVAPEDRDSLMVMEETSAVNGDESAKVDVFDDQDDEYEPELDPVPIVPADVQMEDPVAQPVPPAEIGKEAEKAVIEGDKPSAVEPKVTEDAEFMAAAAAQKEDKNAEWTFDPSDAESSSDSDSDSSSDDSDSDDEDDYQMLDPATLAKILMSGDGEEDDGDKKGKSDADRQPRTVNEVKEAPIPKPDVVITADMEITELGTVENMVDSMVLIKGSTPGEYQVVESGSVLCNDKREVIGAVGETLGRVQEPLYMVQFNSAAEITEAGLTHGTKVFYVNKHSTFVFTQPLKNMKGTDASNIHDEEIPEDEAEFSDDEAEAEYKRQKKLAKKAARGGLAAQSGRGGRPGSSGHDTSYVKGNDAPQQSYGGGMSYDDDGPDEFYSPLKRPDNLSAMMASGGPPRPSFDRGRGRGRGDRGRGDRGRGRGDRGRGRGGFDQGRNQRGGNQPNQDRNQRGGRGGNQQQGNHRGNAQSFPDAHNNERSNANQPHSLPTKPNAPPAPVPQAYPAQVGDHQPGQPQAPQSYQFNGYQFQFGNQQQAQAQAQSWAGHQPQSTYGQGAQPQVPQNPVPQIPPGAYVNPAFYANQQAAFPQQWPQQPAGGYGNWPSQPGAPQQGQAPPQGQGQAQPQGQGNLADILRRLGGQQ